MADLDLPNPFMLMPNILDKLKMLNYEEVFARDWMDGELLHHAYFSTPHPKPNEQFYYFVSVFTWLMKENRFTFQRPDQFDDPNNTVANVMDALRRARLPIDYPPAKVKQGHGEAVCVILDLLCDGALENRGFKLKQPVYPPDNYPEEAPVDDAEEVSGDAIADTLGDQNEDEDEVYVGSKPSRGDKAAKESVEQSRILESTTDPKQWMVEVESVAPMLKMRVEPDNKEWRTHLETTKDLQDNINGRTGPTKESLGKLSTAIGAAMERIGTRESNLNSQYKDRVAEYHEIQEKLQEVTKRYDEGNAGVSDLTNQLNQITDELETIKSDMDSRGDSMTDTGPLVKLKDAMKKIKKDITGMDVRIGTVAHNLLHIKLAHEHSKENDRDHNKDEDDD
uniref:Intraflagellar transport protein 57 homolog n=1 Tax=Hemiselmis tepida TaxID=464990 RepID=A0A7S0W435_9CRYP